ncbi:TPA: cytochrome b5 domain-containing protein [candidate division WWE3 bacterium]|uniref:Cytochrome b5 domain-containing protein n=1 Tax=candidate division WWE3 bacterium TaxID=2053526 RepID=A0A656PLX5_UNCKA|nr:soluble cytochrome b558 [candidate division WWE3 bacterium RAAC2_WWE3_1]KKS29507.1 MAG: Soluble cytochrome b558 [candidate division WWE3 bacterium GW2011_GWB1_42_117]KKS54887.1 MAG: Soluble cytochrome b558 [candidate division WWE3 bacterium GW2011_GWD2_42_34]KKT05503.1 MAG: Soluble cytochrome b558 [candidate division WWE3 bacterium GW2011_GWE2_43_18]KKT06744.1 MAG: Soluble cytochrome b558 [candidate division WWE3 bacterium GW2011_GWF2_43_18]KKT08556.1 MAG: Soluble cytochrome b558 [candidate
MDENVNQNKQPKQSTSPMIIGVVVVGVLLLGGGFLLFSNKSSKSLPQPEGSSLRNSPTAASPGESQVSDTPSTEAKTYSLAEVVTHNSEKDCWMAIEGKVYNVTEFIPKHPGGKAIVRGCGKDASTLFNERPTNNKGPHPAQANELLKGFFIGDLKQE